MTAPIGQTAAMHDRAGHDAIAAELVRLTLGGRGPRRLELDVVLQAFIDRQVAAFEARQLELAGQMQPLVRAIAAVVRRFACSDCRWVETRNLCDPQPSYIRHHCEEHR